MFETFIYGLIFGIGFIVFSNKGFMSFRKDWIWGFLNVGFRHRLSRKKLIFYYKNNKKSMSRDAKIIDFNNVLQQYTFMRSASKYSDEMNNLTPVLKRTYTAYCAVCNGKDSTPCANMRSTLCYFCTRRIVILQSRWRGIRERRRIRLAGLHEFVIGTMQTTGHLRKLCEDVIKNIFSYVL